MYLKIVSVHGVVTYKHSLLVKSLNENKPSYRITVKSSLNLSSPPGAGTCASAPAPPVDRVGGGILAAGCTSA